MDRLTRPEADGVKTFCSGCSDKPMFGKCNIGAECYHRQVFIALQAYEDTGLMPEEIKSLISDAGINIAMRNRELKVENDRLKKALEQAQADTAILREALEQINNLIETEDEDDYMYFSSDKVGEIYESMRNKITSTTAGRDYLDRMRKLESALISLKNGPFIWDKSWTQMIDDALNGDAPFEDLEASTDG